MNTSKKIVWHTAAVAAAALFSAGAVNADGRHFERDYRYDEHHRVWREHDRHHYYDRFDYRSYRYPV